MRLKQLSGMGLDVRKELKLLPKRDSSFRKPSHSSRLVVLVLLGLGDSTCSGRASCRVLGVNSASKEATERLMADLCAHLLSAYHEPWIGF